ncbi:MAG: transposase [Flavobacteriaceae bacterium]|nr:transposase [Flavobacteriaceae bacterium]
MNTDFLKKMRDLWGKESLYSDTVNLDFTTIPYWGDDGHLENHWSGKRNKALASMQAVLAQDSETRIIYDGRVGVLHRQQNQEILEFLDFYKSGNPHPKPLRYVVFDSQFTSYQNLSRLDDDGLLFITIRRRGKHMIHRIGQWPKTSWKTLRVERSSNKKQTLQVHDEKVFLRGYDQEIRQIIVTGRGKVKPAVIITNDFEKPIAQIVQKYARRWLVEKAISEQIEFFHLNRMSSSMVIKVDFDLVMTLLAYHLYRLMAHQLEGFSKATAPTLFQKFLANQADVNIKKEGIEVYLKKKRNLPLLLNMMDEFQNLNYPFLGNKKIRFFGASYT